MKKLSLTITLAIAVIFSAFAQAPEAFKYQAVVRDNAGDILANHNVSLRISIRDVLPTGTILYQETFTETTNDFGLAVMEIGTGTYVSGNFSTIDWGNGDKYMEIELDETGAGTSYTSLGTSQMLSVPFALYAKNATVHEISDADNNTRIAVEENPDEDILRFYVDGTEVMKHSGKTLEFLNNGYSVFLGLGAGKDDDGSTNQNTFVGNSSGWKNTSGYLNSFLGYGSGQFNTSGYMNVFIGARSGYNNTTSYLNTFVGYQSGYSNTLGEHNAFFGGGSGFDNTTGDHNSFFGTNSGSYNTTGYSNSFFGYQSGYSNTSGVHNSFFGYKSGESNTTAHQNSFFGSWSGYLNESGGGNSFFGYHSGYSNISGETNSFFGNRSGYSNISGETNSFFGYRSGYSNTTGSGNIFLGYHAGHNETGSNKLYIENSDASSDNALIYGEFDTDILAFNADVGIGTTTPGAKLDVIGVNPGIGANIRTHGDIHLGFGADYGGALFFGTNGYSWGSGDYIRQVAEGSLAFVTGGAVTMTAKEGALKLGSGSREFELLEVDPSYPDLWSSLIDYGGIGIGSDNGNNRQMFMFTDGAGSENIFTVATSQDNGSTWEADMVIQQDGNVGIGTDSPTEKLYVAGDIYVEGQINHPAKTGYVSVPAAAFRGKHGNDGYPYEYLNDGFKIYTAGYGTEGEFHTNVNIPHGAIVTKLKLFWGDPGEGFSANLKLIRNNMNGGFSEMASVLTPGTETTTISYSTIDNSQYSYYLYANLNFISLMGAIIEYTYTE